MKEDEFKRIGNLIADVVDAMGDDSVVEKVRGAVKELCQSFPTEHLRMM